MITEPPIYLTASLVNGLPTVTFTSRPYSRLVTKVWVNSAVTASVKLYRGLPYDAAIIDSFPSANPATFTAPFELPKGQALYVVFSSAANPVSLAAAKLFASREGSNG